MLEIGDKIPDFNLESSSGGNLSSRDLSGQNAVIVFYPANNTLICNIQLARLEKTRASFEKINTRVLAINPAPVESHRKFCAQKKFNFPILSDPGENVLSQFKAQKNSGRGVIRTVYAFNKNGRLVSAKRGMGDFKQLLRLFKESANQ